MSRSFRITAPSRLHFGLMNFGGNSLRQFGGVGVMIDTPGMELEITPGKTFQPVGPLADRIIQFAERWQNFHRLTSLPAVTIDVLRAPRQHAGLGVGTQLGMSVALGLSQCIGLPKQTPQELATSVGRGCRSAIGIYGFMMGGLIAERGKLQGEPVSPLDCHLHLPGDWRVLLVCPKALAGLASDAEAQAFTMLPSVPEATTIELGRMAREAILPAAARGDFAAFSDAVYQYGRTSGECFASLQGGPYNGPQLTAIISRLRSMGIVGVGQSSWGPTVYGFLPSLDNASWAADAFRTTPEAEGCDITISTVARQGAWVD